jgi:hypothetical protein
VDQEQEDGVQDNDKQEPDEDGGGEHQHNHVLDDNAKAK